VLLSVGSQFFYLFARVEQQEVGVQFKSGQIVNLVGPGPGIVPTVETASTSPAGPR